MKLKITIGREQLVFFAIFLIALAFMGLVAAYGGSQPSVMGHSAGELDLAPLYISGGNVGIGTTNPQAKLHIGGTAGTDGIMFPDGTLQTTAANVRVGQGSVVNGNDFNVQGGGSGTVLLVLKFDFLALYADMGTMTANLRSQGGGSTLKTRTGRVMEWDNRRSGAHVQIFYISTGNSPGETLTFNAYTPDGAHLLNNPDYWYIGL